MKQRHEMLHQQPTYVRGCFTEKIMYVHEITQYKVRTPMYIFQKIK
jgi:hypothetical protein